MTLKISRFLTDAFNKQAKISHFDYKLYVGKPDKMNQSWKQKILDQFGELFLNDANYVIMTKVDGSDEKLVKKFADLAANVLDTEVQAADVKTLKLSSEDNEQVDDEDADDSSEKGNVLLIKLTTK